MTSSEQKLQSPVQFIKTVGPKRGALMEKSGLRTVRDLLFCFPTRYLDRSTLLTSTQAVQYVLNGYEGEITIIGKVIGIEKKQVRGRARGNEILLVNMRDEKGFFEMIWFQGAKYFEDRFEAGQIYAVSARPTFSKYGNLQFAHPDFDRITEDESKHFFSTGKIIPFYRIPKELRNSNIGDLSFRKIVTFALDEYLQYIEESLPEEIVKRHNLLPLSETVRIMHYPNSKDEIEQAKRRLKFEELFFLEILVAMRKNNYKLRIKGHSLQVQSSMVKDFLSVLPFDLTNAQKNVLHEIRADMLNGEPMNRLLQGDVGSGKTIVALIAMLIAIDSGYQAAFMAPTEILADQHARSINKMLEPFLEKFPQYKIKTALVIGGQGKAKRNTELDTIARSGANIIIGTHALFEGQVVFNKLGLVVIDEQHRFGVIQRARLIQKGEAPDCLVMSATPIPRTLSMTLYGDLDVSIIDEMPKNRIPIRTDLRGEQRLPLIYKFIHDKVKEGYQAFVVYPLVEESEKLELKAAQQHYDELSTTFLKDMRVGLLHGRMKWQQKEEVMNRFAAKEFDVLIATTVIEVGIDIPNANIMVINDAHHFGLSQLHQLRGRVGRGTQQSYCILVAPDEVAAASAKIKDNIEYLAPALLEKYKASIRLQTMVKYLDGFKVAEVDLKLRGPGDIFGTKQSGFPEFKYADITEDGVLLVEAKKEAFDIIHNDEKLSLPEHKLIAKNLLEHYSENLKYAKIA